MGIVSEDIQRVKESADLVALISEHVPLKKAGRRYTGRCPFHEENTPSFSVNPELGFYYCFGCQKKGDAISFLREYSQMDFAEAVEYLAKKSNITLHYDSATSKPKSDLTPLLEAVEHAEKYFHELLKKDESAAPARQYVRSRGFDKSVVEQFSLGYAPNKYDALAKKLSPKFTGDQLVQAGLCYKNSRNQLNDVFRNRLIFPIKNASGATIGFGARTLDGTPPKYKNTSETKLYKKSSVLYNIDKAKAEAVKAGYFVVCEGYTDVIAMNLSGIKQAIATCGTAATIEHVKIMAKYVGKIILAFDTDAAGQNATERWLQFIGETQADLYVANWTSSKDPADLYLENPEAIGESIRNAMPFLEFLLERIIKKADISASVEQRAHVAEEIVEIIRNHPSSLVREGYIMRYSSLLNFEPDWFFKQLDSPKPQKQNTKIYKKDIVPQTQNTILLRDDIRQRELLRLCVHEPESVAPFIRGDVFTVDAYREIFDALIENESIDDALNSLTQDSQEILNQILVEDIAYVEEISPYSLDVFSRVVESQMKEFLHKLMSQGAENTADVKRLLDTMAVSLEKGDSTRMRQVSQELLDLKSESNRIVSSA